MNHHLPRFSFPVVFAAFVLASPVLSNLAEAASLHSGQRAYRPMDYMASEELREPVFSPDGQAIAFVRRRAPTSQMTNALLIGNTREDIWLQDAPGKPARNLTGGASDASGWWMPQWSPEGDRLAFLSSRGGVVTLWGWERATDQVRQLSREGVALDPSYQWLDARRVLFIGLPEGEQASPMGQGIGVGKGVERAEAAWAKAKRGELTASVVDSLQFKLPQRRIFVLDVDSGAIRFVGTTVGEGDAESWWLAPGNRAVAFMQAKPATYGFPDRIKQGYPTSIELRLLDGSLLSLNRSLPENVVTTTLRWSPDGQELAFFALEDKIIHRDVMYPNLQYISTNELSQGSDIRWPKVDSKEYPGQLWRVNLRSGEVTTLGTGDLDLGQGAKPPEFAWTASGELLFKATRLSDRRQVQVPPAAAWWVLGHDGSLRAGEEAREAEEIVQRQAFEKQAKPPAPKAQLVAFSGQSRSGIYQQSGRRDGDVLWRVSVDGATQELARVNTFRRAIARFKEQLVEYTCLNGEQCVAKLTFPYGYKPGRRYPVVVDSDTDVGPETTPFEFELTHPDEAPSGDAADFAAGGYVYIWASMPTRKGADETGRNNMLNFTGGILPAVEKVVQMGIADPGRVFLHGTSSMGNGVYGIVTQTSRFKAAVAAISRVDQSSSALSIGMSRRYSDNPFDFVRMGASYDYVQLPFWRNGDHLRRNSPLSYVDRVQTPLLIIDADFDISYMEQAEMFFSALVQQRKPARFVRYWGEGHGSQIPANYRDWYQQVFAWYDQWGDIARDAKGNILFDKDGNVRSRGDAPPLTAADYEHYDVFGPGGETVKH